jgi:hypothetical protein
METCFDSATTLNRNVRFSQRSSSEIVLIADYHGLFLFGTVIAN